TLMPEGADLTDGQLLERFVSGREPAALEALVRRHAPMVWGVCRRVLGNHHDAEDALQATFLVLARKAASVSPRARVGNWLYGVAHQTALKARATRARRSARESTVSQAPEPAAAEQDVDSDLLPLLDRELSRLPEKYRTVIVLCELEGRTGREAARQLGCPEGTVASRLARGRALLAKRLARHGVTLTGAALAGVLSHEATAAVPTSILTSAIRVVTVVGARQATLTAAVSDTVAALTQRVMKAMLLDKIMKSVPALLLLAALGGAAALLAPAPAEEPPKPPPDLGPSRAATPRPRQDLFGDPLPPDAVVRMGSVRWRHVDDFRTMIDLVPSPTGKVAATVSRGGNGKGMVRVWDLSGGRQVCEFPWDDRVPTWSLRFTPDGSRLMFLTPRGVVKFHDPQTGQFLAESGPVLGKTEKDAQHALTTDGRWVVSNGWGNDGKLALTEITADPAARPRQVILDKPPGRFDYNFAEFVCDGKTLLSSTYEGPRPVLLRWDLATGKLVRKTPIEALNDQLLWFTPDGKRVFTARPSGPPPDVLRVWDPTPAPKRPRWKASSAGGRECTSRRIAGGSFRECRQRGARNGPSRRPCGTSIAAR
ncbi:MAG TPA: sigma-70 family RNA polymerase sigma factor, partial [Gemmataceae bacterium]|nr:sigma-70 family RNA polymerase sigma factor [Gemmataceae bacterium]